eukprot:scaffold24978_cov48-Phaeocystis_antarctica.AAC.3
MPITGVALSGGARHALSLTHAPGAALARDARGEASCGWGGGRGGRGGRGGGGRFWGARHAGATRHTRVGQTWQRWAAAPHGETRHPGSSRANRAPELAPLDTRAGPGPLGLRSAALEPHRGAAKEIDLAACGPSQVAPRCGANVSRPGQLPGAVYRATLRRHGVVRLAATPP